MKTPIYTALKEHVQSQNLRLHMPGHAGQNRSMPPELSGIIPFDLTELSGLDDWHAPQGVIKESEQLLAKAVKAAGARWLVNGASSGIEATWLACFSEDSRVLLPRNAHRSVVSGLILSGAWPIYAPLTVDERGLEIKPDIGLWRQICTESEKIDGIFVTSPNYYGIPAEVGELKEIARRNNALLIVDEAHGGHFAFHADYPQSALEEGADIVVQGWHKNFPVFNQGGALLWSAACSLGEKLHAALSYLTTTSPSYPLLASLDFARAYMQSQAGQDKLMRANELSKHYRRKLSELTGIFLYNGDLSMKQDPLKIWLSVAGLTLNGYETAVVLRRDFRIDVEMAQTDGLLAMFSIFHEEKDWEAFYQAMRKISLYYSGERVKRTILMPPVPKVEMSPRKAYQAFVCSLPYQKAAGRIAAQMVVPYPPGIPCLIPGELVTTEMISYMEEIRATAEHIQGGTFMQDGNISVVKD